MSKAIHNALISGIMFAAAAEAGAAAVVPQRLKASVKELMQTIALGGDDGYRVPDIGSSDFKVLTAAHWVDVNPATLDGTSQVVRLNAAGKEKLASFTKGGNVSAGNVVTSRPNMTRDDFEIEKVDLSEIAANQRRPRDIYPFDKLTEPGDSFFVPQPAEYTGKDFAASKQGTVGGRNRKAREEWEALPEGARPAAPATYRAINDTKGGVAGARIIRMS